MNSKDDQNAEYLSMINHLINTLNKAKISPSSLQNQEKALPIFLYEFFVFELYLPRELIKIVKQPILAFRLLDFPTLTLEGNVNLTRESIFFNQGKSSFFEMDMGQLKENLANQPMYIMFLDLNHGNMKIIGTCRLNLSLFAYDSFLNYDINTKGPDPRRNILQLFDNSMEKIGEFEMSLLIRREYYKYDKDIEINEKTKTLLIKKAKKSKTASKKYVKDKNDNFFIKGEEKPKNKNVINYDNNMIMNDNYNQQQAQAQPQYVNNFILEGKDKAFNAHPVNKVITIKPQSKSSQVEQNNKNEEKKKGKKRKITKKSVQTETDLLPGVNVPINNFDYTKNTKKNNSRKKNVNSYDNRPNNQQLVESMYNKVQNNPQYYFPNTEYGSFKDYNNNFNNFYNSSGSNFNTSYYNNQSNNNYNYNNSNNKRYHNIDDDMLFYQTNGMDMNNQNNNNNQINSNNNSNLNETTKSEPNEYLKLITEIKSKVSTYKDKLENEQKNIKKIKEERNINTNLNINMNSNSLNQDNNNEIDNININKNDKNDDDNNDLNNINNNDNIEKNKNNIDDETINDYYNNKNDINNNNINNDNKNVSQNKKETNSNEDNNGYDDFISSDITNNNNNNTDNKNNNNKNEEMNANKFNNIIDNNISSNIKSEIEDNNKSEVIQNISESQSNIIPEKASLDNFVSSSFGRNMQSYPKEEKKTTNDKQNIIESTIKEEEYNDFESNNISGAGDKSHSSKKSPLHTESAINSINKEKESDIIPEESILNKNKNESPQASGINNNVKKKNKNYNESEIKSISSYNKFSNYNYEINKDNEIPESIAEENNINKDKDKDNNNIGSESEIKDDTSLMKYNNMNNNETHEFKKVNSGEIAEEINEDSNNNKKSSKKDGRSGSENIKSYGRSNDTDEIEELLK